MSRYVFDNADAQTPGRFSALETCYDPVSRRRLELTGLAPGWRCLEVGGGGGSLGDWLGERVGPDGEVTITDIDPRWAQRQEPQRLPHVSLLRHDIVTDPLPAGHYDLIHARLVLLHLPERLPVLDHLVTALRPGGSLLIEEFDCGWTPVLAAPDEASATLFERVVTALHAQVEKAGGDPLWGRRVLGAMARAGLTDLTASTHAESWPGGSPGIDLHRVNIEQSADHLRADGLTDPELGAFQALLRNTAFVVNSYPLISAHGRRPHPEATPR